MTVAPQVQASFDPWTAVVGGLSNVFNTLTHEEQSSQSAHEKESTLSRTTAEDPAGSVTASDETGRCSDPNFVVNATFVRPSHDEILSGSQSKETFQLKGFVYSSGGPKSIRLEVSLDDGASWTGVDTIEQKWHMPESSGRYKSSCIWTSNVPVTSLMRCAEIVVRARDSSMGTRQYFRVRTQACTTPAEAGETPRCDEVRFEHLKKLGLEPDTGGSAPRSNIGTLVLPTDGPISPSYSMAVSFFNKSTSPKKLPVGPPCVDPLDMSADSVLDIAFALGGSPEPSAPKRKVYFEQTRRICSIPSRHSITREEKEGQWYNRSDFQGFAMREQARRNNGGVSLDEAPSPTK